MHNEATQYMSRTSLSLERLLVQRPAIGTPKFSWSYPEIALFPGCHPAQWQQKVTHKHELTVTYVNRSVFNKQSIGYQFLFFWSWLQLAVCSMPDPIQPDTHKLQTPFLKHCPNLYCLSRFVIACYQPAARFARGRLVLRLLCGFCVCIYIYVCASALITCAIITSHTLLPCDLTLVWNWCCFDKYISLHSVRLD